MTSIPTDEDDKLDVSVAEMKKFIDTEYSKMERVHTRVDLEKFKKDLENTIPPGVVNVIPSNVKGLNIGSYSEKLMSVKSYKRKN
jgi:hypothetical protein